jgi:hypothetical protein
MSGGLRWHHPIPAGAHFSAPQDSWTRAGKPLRQASSPRRMPKIIAARAERSFVTKLLYSTQLLHRKLSTENGQLFCHAVSCTSARADALLMRR